MKRSASVPWTCMALVCLHLAAMPGIPGAFAVPGDIAGGPGPGDEPDGFVGIADLNRVLGFWNQTCTPGDWTKGDISGDGEVGIEDLNIVLGHWNQRDPDPFLGTNLGPVVYWNSSWAFVDAMKMARPWLTTDGSTFNTGLTVPVDLNGWPTSNPSGHKVFTHVFDKISGHYPAGDYILTWEGTADITVEWDGIITSSTPGRKVVSVTPTNQGIKISIDNINVNDPPQNIRLWMPGFEDAQSPFHPLFISRLRTFKVLRFMDWQKINDSVEVQWSDRKQPTYAFQNDSRGKPIGNPGGVALEYMIRLCNELNADPWFCMPHQADDNYVTQFARMVRDGNPALNIPPLHANATIYVEWSNELWNTAPGFTQWEWLEMQSGDSIRSTPWFQQWANESIRDFNIWKSEFANDSRPVIRVVAGQKESDGAWILRKVIEHMLDPSDPNGKDVLFDAIACSTYFHSKPVDDDGQPITSVEGILDNTLNKIQTDDRQDYDDHALEARKLSDPTYAQQHPGQPDRYTGRTISFISYEGGQHYVPNGNQVLADHTIQRHPKIYQAYVDNIRVFRQAGGESSPNSGIYPWGGKLYMAYYSVGKLQDNDTFGHYEFQDESINNATKHRAVIGGGER